MKTKNGIRQIAIQPKEINKEGLQTYTAQISTLFRDTNKMSPKVTMRHIFDNEGELYRDHCHVETNVELDKLLANKKLRRTNSWLVVEFKARPKSYNYHNSGIIKHTLQDVCDIKILGRA